MQMLKPRLATLNTNKVKVLDQRIGATPRQRGRAWMATRERWLRDHPCCVMCYSKGRVMIAQELDHITPLWAGGKDDESNYQSLCVECHAEKTAEEVKQRAGGGVKV